MMCRWHIRAATRPAPQGRSNPSISATLMKSIRSEKNGCFFITLQFQSHSRLHLQMSACLNNPDENKCLLWLRNHCAPTIPESFSWALHLQVESRHSCVSNRGSEFFSCCLLAGVSERYRLHTAYGCFRWF